jgi:hypothetical protein
VYDFAREPNEMCRAVVECSDPEVGSCSPNVATPRLPAPWCH